LDQAGFLFPHRLTSLRFCVRLGISNYPFFFSPHSQFIYLSWKTILIILNCILITLVLSSHRYTCAQNLFSVHNEMIDVNTQNSIDSRFFKLKLTAAIFLDCIFWLVIK
jgi:uncharacterized membrane protein